MKCNSHCVFISILSLIVMLNAHASSPLPGHFPNISASSLTGRKLSLPSSLTSDYIAVIVAFHPDQQNDVTSCFPALSQLKKSNPQFDFYEIPVMESRYKLSKSVIENFMKNKVKNSVYHHNIMPFYTDLGAFKKSLFIDDVSKTYIFLIENQAKILWRDSDKYTPAKMSALSKIITAKSH